MLTYYITDRMQCAGGESERRIQLLQTIRRAAAAGVDYIQLREKDLSSRELETLAREALRAIRGEGQTRLLINHRTDVALAVEADGVHLTGEDIAASDARALAAGHHPGRAFLVAVSCHSAEEVRRAEAHGADFVVLAPIFEKARAEKADAANTGARITGAEHSQQNIQKGIGMDELQRAARPELTSSSKIEAGELRSGILVFALGGVTHERAAACAAAGAAGIAGIRIFQQCSDLPELVRTLRSL